MFLVIIFLIVGSFMKIWLNLIFIFIFKKKISYNFMRIIIQRVLTAGVKVNLE